MSAEPFERDLRAALDGLASAAVPRSLSETVVALPSDEPRRGHGLRRISSAAIATI